MTNDARKDETTEIGDDDLDGVQGGFGASGGTFAGTRFKTRTFTATRTGPTIPGGSMMEGEGDTEEDLQMRPSPGNVFQAGRIGPKDPGIK